jgi:fatty-acyl-CoA synthase/long-chain acyl-CoA synthetase
LTLTEVRPAGTLGAVTDCAREWSEVVTIGDALVRAAVTDPDGPAVVLPPDRLSYAELHASATEVARGLLGLGVRPGDRVGILMPNCLPSIVTFFANALIGAVTVPVNTRYRAAELAHLLDHAGPAALVTCDGTPEGLDFPGVIRDALDLVPDAAPRLLMLGGGPGSGTADGFIDDAGLDAAGASVPPEEVDRCRRAVRIRDLTVLLYTSGTTAKPKGCMHSHEPLVRTGIARLTERPARHERAAVWIPCPLFHVGALVPLIGCVATRAPFVTSRRFDAGEALRLLREERVGTALPLFAAFTDAMLDHPSFPEAGFPDLANLLTTGSRAQVERAQRAFPEAGLLGAYGMTETCGVSAMSGVDDTDAQRLDWDGEPLRGVRIEVHEPGTGRAAAPGVLGELVIRGWCVFDGYYRDPGATAAAFDAGGWFHTGDIGVRDEAGRVAFRGRYKDMLKVGGENVAAMEIEDLVSGHPAVANVAVIGVPDARLDEVPAAYVELVAGATLEPAELIEFCRARAATFKVPRHVGFVEPGEWPMSATKVNKVALRDRAARDFPA